MHTVIQFSSLLFTENQRIFILKIVFYLVIDEEAIDSRAEVKSFDHTKLKHVETAEKTSLPTAQGKLSC